jgi:hypothetical protein
VPSYRKARSLAALAAAALITSGCTTAPDSPPAGGSPGKGGPALVAVDTLTVKGRAPKTGYEREKFGKAWFDVDGNGCGTRVISMVRRMAGAFVQLMQGVVGCAY